MTSERCLIRALLIMLAICAVCSRVPERLGVNPFYILCSIKLLAVRKEYMALRRQEVNTFSVMLSSVMGRKLDEVLGSPFLWISIVQAFFHSEGMVPDNHTARIRSVRYDLRKGQRLKHIIDS